jgi:hypothetical protein
MPQVMNQAIPVNFISLGVDGDSGPFTAGDDFVDWVLRLSRGNWQLVNGVLTLEPGTYVFSFGLECISFSAGAAFARWKIVRAADDSELNASGEILCMSVQFTSSQSMIPFNSFIYSTDIAEDIKVRCTQVNVAETFTVRGFGATWNVISI